MPSSPSFTDYQRKAQRFVYKGVALLPQDLINDSGKSPFVRNIRSYQEGTFTVRDGLVDTAGPVDGALHSLFRINDPTPGAANSAARLGGTDAGTLYEATLSGFGAVIDSGYSGNPLTALVTAPYNSPRPYAYIGDSVRQRKVNSDFEVSEIGIAPPTVAPTAVLTEPQWTDLINTVPDDMWGPYGGSTVPDTTPVPMIDRVDTVITQVLIDEGSTGMASVALESFINVTSGMWLYINGDTTPIIVQDILPAVSETTIADILYDSGTAGLCTIQPAGSFSVGQIEAPDPEVIKRRYQNPNSPVAPSVTVSRTIDYPVNAIVQLGGTEYVRILSVAIGTDGVESFRCETAGSFSAGASITGIPSFRAWFNSTPAVGQTATAGAVQVTCRATSTDEENVNGIQMSVPDPDWGRVGSRATQPEDIIRVAVRVNLMGFVQAVRLLLDVESDEEVVTAFETNYYFYEWRASDLIAAIQATGATASNQVFQAQATAVAQGRIDQAYVEQYGFGDSSISPVPIDPSLPDGNTTANPSPVASAAPVAIGSGISRQMALGNDVWIQLECRVGDLTRVGTDTTLTLGDISNVAIYVQYTGTTDEMELSFVDPYLIGGYGPDAGATLPPYVYRYRYRASTTGARSNPSPTMRAGVTPRRGRVEVTADVSSNPAVDLVDYFRFGGALNRWTYVGTGPNDGDAFDDDMEDGQIDGGEPMRVDIFQPWPTSDLPQQGTCHVVGTSVLRLSGPDFNTNWSADSAIIINGRATQLYGPPLSADRLEVIDNCGFGTGVAYTLPSPTLLAQPLAAIWGGPINDTFFTFACGDPQDPSALHWTDGNDPDTTSDAKVLLVSSPSEPLLNGGFFDGFPYVFSSEKLYRIIPNFGGVTDFLAQETNCTRGLWSRWGVAFAPQAIFFIANDGIYMTDGGAEAESIIDPDLRPLFPQEGTVAQQIRGMNPIDFGQPDRLRLAWVGQMLYFDYVDIVGESHTLLYEPRYQRWSWDRYPNGQLGPQGETLSDFGGVRVRLEEPGEGVYDQLLGFGDGVLRSFDADQLTDVDQNLPWEYDTSWDFSGDPRALKQWGDAVLDFNPGGSINGITVTPVIVNGNQELTPQVVGIGGVVRDTYLIEVEDGVGVLSRNFGMKITGFCELCDTQRPLFYLWEPTWLSKQTPVARRATDWEDLGYKGAKFVKGVGDHGIAGGATTGSIVLRSERG